MAANLVKAGRQVCGYDLAPPLCTEAAQSGVHVAASAGAAAHGADVSSPCWPTAKRCSRCGPSFCRRQSRAHFYRLFHDRHRTAREVHRKAQDAGALSVDAPVSGGVAGAPGGNAQLYVRRRIGGHRQSETHSRRHGKNHHSLRWAGLGQARKSATI